MSMLPKLLEIDEGLNSGVQPDRHPQSGFVWKDSRNVSSTVSGVRKVRGWATDIAKPNTDIPRGMGQLLDGTTTELFWGTVNSIHKWDGSVTSTPGTGFSGNLSSVGTTPATTWSMVEWGAWIIATNGQDAPQIYKGTSFSALTGTPPNTAEIVALLGPHAIFFNTNIAGNEYHFSDEDDVENWTTGASGTKIIRDFDSVIIAVVPLGDRLAIYGSEKMAILTYIGTPLYFGDKVAITTGIGAVSKTSVVSVKNLNYGLSSNGFFRTDGVSVQDIDLGSVRETFQRDVNMDHLTKINAWHNEADQEIIWYYPSGTSTEPDKGISYNYTTGAWHFLGYGRTASTPQRVFPNPYATDSVGAVYKHNDGANDNANPMIAYVQSQPFPFSSGDRDNQTSMEDVYKYIDAIKLYTANFNSVGIKIRIGVQDQLDDDIVWTDTLQLSDPTVPIYPMVSGRWITLRVESSQLDDTWELQGFVAHGKFLGGPAS